ncbi:MAG: methyltransferase domain-containing protein [Acidobacteria bacterium]|nr:methyltransferase domain-containing protein [Acidobacteriota bacterium]
MPQENAHEQGRRLYAEAKFQEAARMLARAIGEQESSEVWNDWATAQLHCGNPAEAEQGYTRALELNEKNGHALVNLGTLLVNMDRLEEAVGLLEMGIPSMDAPEQEPLKQLVAECRRKQAERGEPALQTLANYLGDFVAEEEQSQQYFKNQLSRYLVTLELLPSAVPGERLLEVGASYHHQTPALKRWKGYDVRCTDLWDGPQQWNQTVANRNGDESHIFPVDNFDVEQAPWPYPDASFDVVLLCELLEHLSTDPMRVMGEINRVLKKGGRLLLSTPNVTSARSVEAVLRGESPYFWGQYEVGGLPTDHHNREYTPGEVVRLAGAAGFSILTLRTAGGVGAPNRSVLRELVRSGHPIAWRGDCILVLAQKEGPVRDRYPAEFYARTGTQEACRRQRAGRPAE